MTIINRLFFKIFKRPLSNSAFGRYSIVEPAEVSDLRFVPDHIDTPDYFEYGHVPKMDPTIDIKDEDDIELMRDSCSLAANILRNVGDIIKVGTTTDEIDKFVHEVSINNNAYPSPLWYRFFPKSVCTSVNNVACHGIPDNRPLEDGDIINVDITVYLNGFHGDCSKTFLVGDVDDHGKELVDVTTQCLMKGISVCGPDVPFKEIGNAIQNHAISKKFTVLPAFLGHGVGRRFHEMPEIYHIKNDFPGVMKKGMTFTIEPILSSGGEMVEILEDRWTAVTADGARSAQTEHTILITDDGCEILTK